MHLNSQSALSRTRCSVCGRISATFARDILTNQHDHNLCCDTNRVLHGIVGTRTKTPSSANPTNMISGVIRKIATGLE